MYFYFSNEAPNEYLQCIFSWRNKKTAYTFWLNGAMAKQFAQGIYFCQLILSIKATSGKKGRP